MATPMCAMLESANALTLDEARRIASNIAKLKAANHPPVSGANLAAQSPPVPYW
jgi:hypothetical protein